MRSIFRTLSHDQTKIQELGKPKIENPIIKTLGDSPGFRHFVNDNEFVRVDSFMEKAAKTKNKRPAVFELAGPRSKIYFDPTKLKAAIVTCGGMCPGINSLVRAIVLQLHHMYGVSNVVGIKFGLQGFIPKYGHDIVKLTPQVVENIHGRGGSFLGMSRGGQSIEDIIDSMERLNIGLLFMIGGDGTLHATQAITKEITKRGLKTAVVAIPKTIDNDICFVSQTFGFQTAVEAAAQAILGAHNEATGAPNGLGLVKLMGRMSGFVATHATLALTEVNFCLIPEIDFELDGENGLLAKIEERILHRGHAVIVAAEGAGQNIFANENMGKDPSGNVKLGDIGTYLKKRINDYFAEKEIELNLKYIDPSYLIRSVPCNSNDRIYTGFLGHAAVHAGLAGKTGLMVSKWDNHFVHVPVELAIKHKKYVDPEGSLWRSVREATGQPHMVNS